MKQTLSVNTQERAHPGVQKTHNRELILPPNTLLVYDVFEAGDDIAVGYVGIIDINETYHFFDKVFFKASNLKITKDFKLPNNIPDKPKSTCGYIDVNLVGTDFTKISRKPKKVISFAEKKRRDFLNSLSKDEKEFINMLYKIRVIEMERKQGTKALETALLDKVEYMKSKFGSKFNVKNYIKGISKKYDFKHEKLNSGYKKRIACRKWAKRDFLIKSNKNS